MPVLINQPLCAKALQSGDNDYYRLFNHALKKDKRLAAIKGATQNTAPTKLESIGTIPPELYGTFYRNGPAKNEFHNRRYTHWFDGDGMIHAFRL
ncbi:MAG: carotenoid oxygenase family protein, partial [Alphaproteobacteria bacterium]|nr:carotenoid oxygenase family protein [Alphaproteobacteria bacterium]